MEVNKGDTNFQAERVVCVKAGHEKTWCIRGHQVAHCNWGMWSEERRDNQWGLKIRERPNPGVSCQPTKELRDDLREEETHRRDLNSGSP